MSVDPLDSVSTPDPSTAAGTQKTPDPAAAAAAAGIQNTPAPKLAGKFDSPADLTKGIRSGLEVLTKAGLAGVIRELPADGDLIGEGKPFADNAAAEAFYKGVETALGKLPKPKEAAPGSITAPVDTPPAGEKMTELSDEAVVAKIGPDKFNAVRDEFLKNGRLTDAQYAEAAAMGFSKTEINLRLENAVFKAHAQVQRLQANEAAATAALGGAQVLQAAREFANTLPQAEKERYQKMVAVDPDTFPAVMQLINNARLAKLNADKAGSLVTGGAGGTAAPAVVDATTIQQLHNKARQGDKAARATLDAMPLETIHRAAAQLV